MVNCCVPFCKSRHKAGCGISFHDFPVDQEQCRQWLARISRKNWVPNFDNSGGSRVCSLHFKPTDYKEEAKRRVLKPGVLPSIFPHYPKYMQPREHKPRSTKAIEKREKAASAKKGTTGGKMEHQVTSVPVKSTFGQNRGGYIVPTTAAASGTAASTSGTCTDATSLLLLSDVRSLAVPSTSGTAQTFTIKSELPEECTEEDAVQSTSVSSPPVLPSSVVTSTPQAVRLQRPTSLLVNSRVVSTAGQVSSTASAPQYVQRLLPSPMTATPPEQPARAGSYVAVRKRLVPWSTPSGSERKTKLEEEVLVEQKKKLEAEFKIVEAELRRVESEERKIVTETLLRAAEIKKCEEERNKFKAEAEFFLQEKKRSQEEARKAAAIAEFHRAEKRKAEAQEQIFVEQMKTETVRRKLLLYELNKMTDSAENNHLPYGNASDG